MDSEYSPEQIAANEAAPAVVAARRRARAVRAVFILIGVGLIAWAAVLVVVDEWNLRADGAITFAAVGLSMFVAAALMQNVMKPAMENAAAKTDDPQI